MPATDTYISILELAGPATWVRGNAQVADGWVELTSLEHYEPCAPHVGMRMLTALASLRSADDAACFAQEFGLLFSGPDAANHREPISDMKTVARSLRSAVTLYAELDAAAAGDEVALDAVRRGLREFRALHGAHLEVTLDQYREVDQAAILIAQIISAAMPRQEIVASALLYQTEHGHDYRVAGNQPAFFLRPRIENLVALAHQMLALTIANRVAVGVCPGCSTVFVPVRPNQVYHDARCSNRARQARLRRG